MSIVLPDWFDRLDLRDPDDQRLRNRFFIKSAALLHNPHANLEQLAEGMGISLVSLLHCYSPSRGKLGPVMALRLQRTIGEDKLPARLILPDLF